MRDLRSVLYETLLNESVRDAELLQQVLSNVRLNNPLTTSKTVSGKNSSRTIENIEYLTKNDIDIIVKFLKDNNLLYTDQELKDLWENLENKDDYECPTSMELNIYQDLMHGWELSYIFKNREKSWKSERADFITLHGSCSIRKFQDEKPIDTSFITISDLRGPDFGPGKKSLFIKSLTKLKNTYWKRALPIFMSLKSSFDISKDSYERGAYIIDIQEKI